MSAPKRHSVATTHGVLGADAHGGCRASKARNRRTRHDARIAGGGYSLIEYATKVEASALAAARVEATGEGANELFQVSEVHRSLADRRRWLVKRAAAAGCEGTISVRCDDGGHFASWREADAYFRRRRAVRLSAVAK